MRLFPIFASNLVECTFEEKNITDKLFGLVDEYEYINSKQPGSNGSTSTVNKKILDDHPEIKESLLKYFYAVNERSFFYPCKFDITTSWFTKVKNQCFSQFHSHRNSFYSGVLYFGEYPEGITHGPIEFDNPNSELPNYYVIPTTWNIHNCNSWQVYPKKNMLLFFPSHVRHRIGNHNSDITRYSLAFNIVPIGSYGEGDSSYSTEWFN